MREYIATILMISLIYYFMLWMNVYKAKYIFIVAILFIFSFLIRAQNAALILITLFPFTFYTVWKRSGKYMKVIASFFNLALILGAYTSLRVTGFLRFLNMDYIIRQMNFRTDGSSAYLEWMSYGNIFDVVLYSPIRLFYFLYTLFPWQISNLTQLVAFIEICVVIVMTIPLIKSLKLVWKESVCKKEFIVFIIYCTVGLTTNAIIDSNVGTAMRHKVQYIYFFFILYYPCVYLRNKKHSNKNRKFKGGISF